MARERRLPDDPIGFVQERVRRGRIFWTYHVNMRLAGRFIPREAILASVDTYELVEAYPDDKYLPSYHSSRGTGRRRSTCYSRRTLRVIMFAL